eukprot:gene8145-11025_t
MIKFSPRYGKVFLSFLPKNNANLNNIGITKVYRRCFSLSGFTEAGEESSNLPGLSPEQLTKIQQTDFYLRTKHTILESTLSDQERDAARRKRMIYRSKQRGWLEADILLGSWASEYVPTLTLEELDDYELILKEETIDIFNYVSGKDKLPDHLDCLPLMHKLKSYALRVKLSEPSEYADLKKKSNLT